MILIAAGCRREAEVYAHQTGLQYHRWHYVHDVRVLMGYRNVDIVIHETFWHRRWDELLPVWLLIRKMSLIDSQVHFATDPRTGAMSTTPPLEV